MSSLRGNGTVWLVALMVGLGAVFAVGPAVAQTVNTQGLAQESQSSRDVDIEADQMQVLEGEQKAIFTGNVDAKRGTVTLNSDKLVVHYRENKQQDGSGKTEVTFLDATGHVVIITRNQHITGQWAKMDVKANQVNIGGNVVVRQGKTVIKGQKLFVDLDKNVSQMWGGWVKGSFTPGSN